MELIKIGFAGFGKSFMALNLAALMEDAVIYADPRAPYRVWNKSEKVIETWRDVERSAPRLVLIDHEESQVAPDLVVYAAAPDPVRIAKCLGAMRQVTGRAVLPVLNGYDRDGAPWLFDPSFQPVAVVPWDVRQASAAVLGVPLVRRDPGFRKHFEPLMEAIISCG